MPIRAISFEIFLNNFECITLMSFFLSSKRLMLGNENKIIEYL